MKNRMGITLVTLVVATLTMAGCSGTSGGDATKSSDSKELTDTASIAKKVDGDYDKLSGAEKQQVLQAAGNDEQRARTMLKMMAHPPNERMRNGGGPPGRPQPPFGR